MFDFYCQFVVLLLFAGGNSSCNSQFHNTRLFRNRVWAKPVSLELSRKRVSSSRNHVFLREKKGFLLLDCYPENSVAVRAASIESLNYEQFLDASESSQTALNVNGSENSGILEPKPEPFRNRFLNFARIGTIINNALESFFKSEIRTRLFVTAVLLVVSRLGYFIPLPGFDRRLMPENYLNFLNGSTGEKIIAIFIFASQLNICRNQPSALQKIDLCYFYLVLHYCRLLLFKLLDVILAVRGYQMPLIWKMLQKM